MAKTAPDGKGQKPVQKTPVVISQETIRRSPFFYLHLSLMPPHKLSSRNDDDDQIDPLTARSFLSSALEHFLGLTGSAIPVDILKCEGTDVWVRVPNEDASVIVEAVSGWVNENENVAWRIKASGIWLAGLAAGNGRDIFE